ncbi:DNA polymerase III subunit gamma/tau [Candidatus Shapirobacteria bacterium]|nr:DNA polymerase III subunit gamma/tau [Candidatus Shapirobacteria bacterium]
MTVFHLKYRPKTLAELDSVEVGEALVKIFSTKDYPRSFLFTGPKGSGKTSAARIVAKVVNCEDVKKGDACDKCANCVEIARGGSVDVMEIDAASNRGIEDIRILKDRAYLLPTKLKRKVFIIDEVHMLTKEAFNALLKLIEEPPEHTFFILCTTDPGKIPETVMSRLVKVDFKKGKKIELHNSLKRTIEGEGIEVDEATLEIIIAKSDGSFRNIQRNFNEVVMALGKKLEGDAVLGYFDKTSGEYAEIDWEADMVAGNLKKIIDGVEKMATIGVDFREYRERLVTYFHKKIVVAVSGEKTLLTVEEMQKWLNLLITAGKQEKDAVIDELPLELAIIEFLSSKKQETISKQVPSSNTQEPNKKTNEVIVKLEENLTDENIFDKGTSVIEIEKIVEEWGKVLVAVKPFNHSVEAFLRAVRPVKIRDHEVVLEVFYPFHKDKLEESKNREIVEKGLKDVFNLNLRFRCLLVKDKTKPLEIKNDTPMVEVSDELAAEEKPKNSDEIYNVAKEIFG